MGERSRRFAIVVRDGLATAVYVEQGGEFKVSAADYVLERLRAVKRVEFGALVAPWGTRVHAVMSLLACLELAKRSELRLR